MAGEDVCVVGGANSAGQAALHLAKYAARVTLLVRGAVARRRDVRLPGPPDRGHAERRRPARAPGSSTAAATPAWRADLEDCEHRSARAGAGRGGVRHDRRRTAHRLARPGPAPDEHGFVLTGRDVPATRLAAGRGRPCPFETSRAGCLRGRRRAARLRQAGRRRRRRGLGGRGPSTATWPSWPPRLSRRGGRPWRTRRLCDPRPPRPAAGAAGSSPSRPWRTSRWGAGHCARCQRCEGDRPPIEATRAA